MEENKPKQTIWLPNEIKERLDTFKSIKNEPYYSVLVRLMDRYEGVKK